MPDSYTARGVSHQNDRLTNTEVTATTAIEVTAT